MINRKRYVQEILDAFSKWDGIKDAKQSNELMEYCLNKIDDFEEFTQEQERLAFVDWLEKWYNRLDKAMAKLNDKEINKCWKEIETKIKELRSEEKDK